MKKLFLLLFLLFPVRVLATTTVRSSSTNTAASGTALSITAPSGTTTGDLVFVVISSNGLITHTDNNGSTPFTEDLNDFQGSASGTFSVWHRRIIAGDPSTYNFTIGATTRWTIHAITLQNPNASSIFDGSIATNSDGSATLTSGTAPTITTGTNNSIHFAVLTDDGSLNTITSTPAGYTCPQNSGNQGMALCYKVIATAGATGAQTFSWTSVSEYNSASFAVLDEGSGGGGGNAASLVANTIQSSSAGFTTTGINTSACTPNCVILVALGEAFNPGCTVADNQSNTYTQWGAVVGFGEASGHLHYIVNANVGSSHTWTLGGGAQCAFVSIAVQVWKGATASPIDQINSGTGASASVTSVASGSITPMQAMNVTVSLFGGRPLNTPTNDSSFTISNNVAFSAGNFYGLAFGYKIKTTAASENVTWTQGSAGDIFSIVADIKTNTASSTSSSRGMLSSLGVGR